jgi:hypothetical protein
MSHPDTLDDGTERMAKELLIFGIVMKENDCHCGPRHFHLWQNVGGELYAVEGQNGEVCEVWVLEELSELLEDLQRQKCSAQLLDDQGL